MLRSRQISAISANSLRKSGVFIVNQFYDNFLHLQTGSILSKKRQCFFAKFVRENIFKIITYVGRSLADLGGADGTITILR
jgi:hypothetical protein